MLKLQGQHNEAIVYTDNIDEGAISQIISLCNEEFTKGSKIRIMPDAHAGAGCVIGTTMTIEDKVCPNLVGVDIGCGVIVANLGDIEIDYPALDAWIKENIPAGMNVNQTQTYYPKLQDLKCIEGINKDRALLSLKSLGGGNHFISIEESPSGSKYLIIHTGSRYLGKQVSEYYQNKATKKHEPDKEIVKEAIDTLKREGRESEIEYVLSILTKSKVKDKALAYLEGDDLKDYLHDIKITQEYASTNRYLIAKAIADYLKLNINCIEHFETVHNYIDVEAKVLRKGAVSAKSGEKLIIPINMKDGSLLCLGKGNPEWNYSAPHGSGRVHSRSSAKANLSLEEFQESMKGIYSTTIGPETLDEAPMAYKPIDEIFYNTLECVDLIEVLRPTYNFRRA